MAVLVREVMIKDPVTLKDTATIGEAVEVFAEKRVGCLPMVDAQGNLTAFLSDGDIVDYVAATHSTTTSEHGIRLTASVPT